MNINSMPGRGALRARVGTGAFRQAVRGVDDVSLAARMARACARLAESSKPMGIMLQGHRLARSARRIGLISGSFNPLTRAHVELAEAAAAQEHLDMIVWILTLVTVDKEQVDRASLIDRLMQMVLFARRTHGAIALFNRGLYADQAQIAQEVFPQATELVTIVGYDKVVQILDPRYYDNREDALKRLFSLTKLLVAPRSGSGEADLRRLLTTPENAQYARQIAYCPVSARFVEDSSTEARAMAASTGKWERLADILAPEGMALALGTGAYSSARHDIMGTPPAFDVSSGADPYAIRLAWVKALSSFSAAQLHAIPGLGELVAATVDSGPSGDALRRWLANAPGAPWKDLQAALRLPDVRS